MDTDTGMSANVATGGFLGLGSSAVGGNQYLLKPNGKTKCANGGTTEATTVLMGQTDQQRHPDLLLHRQHDPRR